jgi:glycosyltransferase involved in cell wall biosynthesis
MVIAQDEEASIARCLRSVPFVSEIIVIDSGSVDRTREIAGALGATVVQSPDWPGFGAQKNRALARCTGDWVLSLDADEWIEPALAEEIRQRIADPASADGYEIPRRSRFCGHVVRHSGWSPDYVLRLFRRKAASFTDDRIHEKAVIRGRVARLRNPIEHEPISDMADARSKVRLHSAEAARQLVDQGRTSTHGVAIARAGLAFLRVFLWRLGILDGVTGLRVGWYVSAYTYRKWALVAVLAKQAARGGKGTNHAPVPTSLLSRSAKSERPGDQP